jgi:DNA-binding FadR family transcriptional regulator
MPTLLAEAIAEGIVSRGMRPGDRLATEAEMVAEYEVGRATVREALRVLEAQGVIEIRVGAGGGPFVARPDAHRLARMLSLLLRMSDVTLREVLDARLIIEPSLAGQAARHRHDSQVVALRANQRALTAAPRGSAEFMRVNEEFHTLIADASGNRPLAALWSALAAIADGHEAGVRYTPAALGAMIAAHRKIADAIIAADADEASRTMTLHLEATRDYVARYYPSIIDTPVVLVSDVSRLRALARTALPHRAYDVRRAEPPPTSPPAAVGCPTGSSSGAGLAGPRASSTLRDGANTWSTCRFAA